MTDILTPLDGAHDWASRDLYVFPITAGKKAPPLVTDWENAATTDAAQINKWAMAFKNCNWGCAPGRSGHVVLDLDVKNGKDGLEELQRLAAQHGFDVPDTLIVSTPNGGFHLYLKGLAQSSASKLAPGVDVRSRGGYVVAPGSEIDGKPYVITNNLEAWDSIPDASAPLLALMEPKKTTAQASAVAGNPFTPAELVRMLSFLDPGCARDEWRDIAAALHAAPCTDATFDKRELFVRWSRGEVRQ